MISELNYDEYRSTLNAPMVNVPETAFPAIDIWPLVSSLVELEIIPKIVLDRNLVEFVYRDKTDRYDHVLLPTTQSNKFVCLIVDIQEKRARGYYILNLAKEYGTEV